MLAFPESPVLNINKLNNKKMSEKLIVTRSTWNDEMVKELAQIVGKQVNEWCNGETPLEDCIGITENILKYHSDANGYKLAKEFENEGFSPDSELVEILDSASYDKIYIQEVFFKKWVAENNLKLELTEGQKVIAKLDGGLEVEGEIVKLYHETMQYGFWHEGTGFEKGKSHTFVDFENIVSVLASDH